MKKIINGAVFNTSTAKVICTQHSEEASNEKGTYVKQTKELYKTKSGNYFFFIKLKFPSYVDVNHDDLDPKFELMEVEEEKIIPINYTLASQFASEIIVQQPKLAKSIASHFPELASKGEKKARKIQKKLYLSEKANWYLEMLLTESEETNSSYIEKLITNEYKRLYDKGVMKLDPYFEMDN